MSRTAQACAGWLVALAGGPLALAACGGTGPPPVRHAVMTLCVDVGLPLSGPDRAAGRGMLAGLEMELPARGTVIGGTQVRICRISDTATTGRSALDRLQGDLRPAQAAAADRRTIAYIGGLRGRDVEITDAALAPAGVPLITPAPGSSAPLAFRGTALYLQPAQARLARAVAAVRSAHGCERSVRGIRTSTCTVLTTPLCTGIPAQVASALRVSPTATASSPTLTVPRPGSPAPSTRLCVLGGPSLIGWASPATAYGNAAARLLLGALSATAAGGGRIADRATVLDALRRVRLPESAIGPIRFTAAGDNASDQFTSYTVRPSGRPVLSATFGTP